VPIALVIHNAKLMRSIVLSSLTSRVIPYFFFFFHKLYDFQKKKCYRTLNVFLFSLLCLSDTFLIIRRIQRNIIVIVHRCSSKVPLFLSHFNETRISSTNFLSILKFHENPSSGSPVVPCRRTDSQTDGQR
jgi:hypothetical protein